MEYSCLYPSRYPHALLRVLCNDFLHLTPACDGLYWPVMAAPDEAGLISTVVSYINTPHSSPASFPPTSSMPMISPRCKNRVLADCRGRPPSQPHWGFCRQVHRKILPKCVKNIHLCQKMLNGEQEMANTSKFWMHFWSNFPDLPVALLFII